MIHSIDDICKNLNLTFYCRFAISKIFDVSRLMGSFIHFDQNRFPLDFFSDSVYITIVWAVDIYGTKNSKAQISIFEFVNCQTADQKMDF